MFGSIQSHFKSLFEACASWLLEDTIKIKGRWTYEAWNPDGSLAWRETIDNMTTLAGLDNIIGVQLAGTTQVTTWYAGLIDNAGYTGIAAADTSGTHSGWVESSAYTESVRQTWTPGAVSGQSVTNPTAMSFSINATVTIKGGFLISNNTKGGTTGTLFATGLFGSAQALVSGQSLKVTYTCSATGS